jgi:hypothetical protein
MQAALIGPCNALNVTSPKSDSPNSLLSCVLTVPF